MNKLVLFSILISVFCANTAFAKKKIALSFDDSPRFAGGHLTGKERSLRLIEALKEVTSMPVVFFSNSVRLNPEGLERLRRYNDAGHIIANHTHSHLNFNTAELVEYRKDFLLAETRLLKFSNFQKMFRFPFLREGNTVEKRDGMRRALKDHGYVNAYATVDFADWHLESIFQDALKAKKAVDLEALRALYLSLAKTSLEHYDNLAIKYLGRSPSHVLLLHENDIAAMFIADLAGEMKNLGWEIISNEEAYKDDIANRITDRVMPFNPGRIGEIALDQQHPIDDVWAISAKTEYISKRFQNEVLK